MSWLGRRWAVGSAAWAAFALAVWFAGDALAPLEGRFERFALIMAVGAGWLAWELWRARRILRENERLLEGLVGGIAEEDSAQRAAQELTLLRKRFEEALVTLRRARFRGGLEGHHAHATATLAGREGETTGARADAGVAVLLARGRFPAGEAAQSEAGGGFPHAPHDNRKTPGIERNPAIQGVLGRPSPSFRRTSSCGKGIATPAASSDCLIAPTVASRQAK